MILFIRIQVRPQKRKELLQTLGSIIAHVRKQRGCLHAGYYQDAENETDFLVIEEWATQTDSDDHLRSDIFTILLGAESLMRRKPQILIHTVDRSAKWEA